MHSLDERREEEVASLAASISTWASQRVDVRAAALIGSWARRSARMNSDVDLLLLTNDVAQYIKSDRWVQELGASAVVRTKRWGVLTERRLVMPSGLEIDVGLAPPSWACTEPLDPGTLRVASDGLVSLYDADGLLAALGTVVTR
jgi:predicted nucleotidyltransferase